MAQIIEVLEYLKRYPVFNNTVVRNRLDKSDKYVNLFIHRLSKRGLIHKIERNKYSVFKDPFLIASRIVWPSYISCWSALRYHNLTEQIPHDITVVIPMDKKNIVFGDTMIRFVKTKPNNLFGYEKVGYNGSEIFMADIEKAIIDSALLRKVSFSELMEIISKNVGEIKINNLLKYLKKVDNRSLIKRVGYTFDELGKDYHVKLKRYIDATYIPLDYSKKVKGKKDEKWRVIVNA